ncbi:hypothetical protein DXG01_009399, partial [Tephrocybe rancida]
IRKFGGKHALNSAWKKRDLRFLSLRRDFDDPSELDESLELESFPEEELLSLSDDIGDESPEPPMLDPPSKLDKFEELLLGLLSPSVSDRSLKAFPRGADPISLDPIIVPWIMDLGTVPCIIVRITLNIFLVDHGAEFCHQIFMHGFDRLSGLMDCLPGLMHD